MDNNKFPPLVIPMILIAASVTGLANLDRIFRRPSPKKQISIEVFINGKKVEPLDFNDLKVVKEDPNAELEVVTGFERGGKFFLYENQRQSIGYIFNTEDLLDAGGIHPIYGAASGTITTNPNMEVTLEIPKPLGCGIEQIFIGEKDCLDMGSLTTAPPKIEDPIRYSMIGPNSFEELVYWQGKLNLRPGDNRFSPIVRFDDGKWSGVGVDWRYITCFIDTEQAREYALSPRRKFNAYRGDNPNTLRAESEREMTSQLSLIIDKAIVDGRLE